MDVEEIIDRILEARPDLTRERVRELIEERAARARAMSMLSVALAVARDLGVEINVDFDVGTHIGDLVPGLSDVTVTGRIMRVWGPRTFRRRDGSEGKVASLLLADSTGQVRVVLWDEKAELVELGELQVGQVVRIAHGYTRESLVGRAELHVGPRAVIQVSPPGVDESKYPSPYPEPKQIGSVSAADGVVSVEGTIIAMREPRTFRRADGSEGKVLRLRLSDGTGTITCVLWDEAAEVGEGLGVGARVRLLGAKVRESLAGQLELHVERESQVEVLEAEGALAPELVKVADLRPGQYGVNLAVRVLRVGGLREVRTGTVATLVVADETGSVRLDLWDDKAELASKVRPGDVLLIRNAHTRERRGALVVNVGKMGSVELNPEGVEVELPPVIEAKIVPLGQITSPGGPYTVEVVIETAPELREVLTYSGERVAVASAQVSDGTGQMRLTLWRDLADQLMTLPVGTRIRVHNVWAREGPFGLELTSGLDTFVEVVGGPGEAEGD